MSITDRFSELNLYELVIPDAENGNILLKCANQPEPLISAGKLLAQTYPNFIYSVVYGDETIWTNKKSALSQTEGTPNNG